MPFLLFLLLGKKEQGKVWMPMELIKGKECYPTLAERKYLATPSQLKTKSRIGKNIFHFYFLMNMYNII